MKRTTTVTLVVMLFLISSLAFAANFRIVGASSVIHIRADGSIEPSSTPIMRNGDIYRFFDDISGEIVIERNNSVVDGNGYTLVGFGNGTGLYLHEVRNVTVRNTRVNDFEYGVLLSKSLNNTLYSNYISGNKYGITLIYSSGTSLRSNEIKNNEYNFHVLGLDKSDYLHDVATSNTVESKPMYYWVDEHSKEIPQDAGYVGLIGCTNITVANLSIANVGQGILLAHTTETIVRNNNVENCLYGSAIHNSLNNQIFENEVMNNEYGVFLSSSINNTMFQNKLIENEYGVALYESNNNSLYQNNITRNNRYGLWLWWCSDTSVIQNIINANTYGLVLWGASYNCISQNNITENEFDGIVTYESPYNQILQNDIMTNDRGIWLRYSSNSNNISQNSVRNNEHGLRLHESSKNSLSENTLNNNTYNFGVLGQNLSDFVHQIPNSNLVNDKPIYYLQNHENLVLNYSTHPQIGYLGLINCTNVTIKLRPLMNNEQGLLLVNTNGSAITDSIVTKNLYGFWLGWSSNNIITINNITKNSHGIHFHQSSNNSVYYNNFVNNQQHASTTHDSANSWDHSYPHGGNYWTNHSGIDAYTGLYQNVSGTDGISDTPYIISENNVDLYPLMKLRIRVPTDLNRDGVVDISDIVFAGEAFGAAPNTARWMTQADLNKDDYIGIDDIVRIARDFGKSWK